MLKVTANKNKNSQHLLRVKVFNTVFRYFFRKRLRCVGVILRKEATAFGEKRANRSRITADKFIRRDDSEGAIP